MFAQYFWFPTFPMIKTFLKLKTQIKKLCSLLLDNLGNTSKTTHDLDKVILIFQIKDQRIMRSRFCVKGQILLFPPHIKYSD